MKRTTRRATIALDLQDLDAPGLVSFTRAIGKGLTNNANITAADAAKLPFAVTDLLGAATSLESTHTTRQTSPSKANTKLERNQSDTLMDYLKDTAAFIEGLANTKAAGDYTLAAQIITSVGFQLRKIGTKTPQGFEAESPAKGTAHVHVPAGAAGAVRLLQYSADGGKTWSVAIVVHGTTVILTGLKSGVEYSFEMATSTPPAKRAKLTIAAGSEQPAWGDAVTCVIS